jgi:hypothetical protein
LPGRVAHLWPFSRALFATLDVAGIEEKLIDAFDRDTAIEDDLRTLERYWHPRGGAPAYSSDVRRTRFGGDRYYDDNAWVGLALVQLERMRPGSGYLDRAEELFRFAADGWDRRSGADRGGVFWVEQGIGAGTRNHDRNTVSNAPNAELGLHLAELRGVAEIKHRSIGAEDMYGWVLSALDESHAGDSPGTGLFWDKVRGDGTVDKTLWSYNQGCMVGVNVLLARRGGVDAAEYLGRAEAIARKALQHDASGWYERQPAAFNAICFRNLLLLHSATGDHALQAAIISAIRGYADRCWDQARDRRTCFHLSDGGVTLLNQSALVQLLALLAWDPRNYRKLA